MEEYRRGRAGFRRHRRGPRRRAGGGVVDPRGYGSSCSNQVSDCFVNPVQQALGKPLRDFTEELTEMEQLLAGATGPGNEDG